MSGLGNYKIRRILPAGQFHIGSAVQNQGVSGFGINATGPDGGQIIPDLNNPCNPTQVDVTSPYGNLLELRENPAVVLSNCAQSLWHIKSAGSLESARGYALQTNTPVTLQFQGTVHNGNITYSGLGRQSGTIDQYNGTQTRGWHLVSNPYPSPIRLTNGSLGPDFDNAVYLLNNGTFIPVALNINDAVIASGQGFQIRKTVTGGIADFTLNNGFREDGNPVFYSNSNSPNSFVRIFLQQANLSSEALIYFEDGATADFDPQYDANCLQGRPDVSLLYTISGDQQRLAFDARTSLNLIQQQSIPLGIYDADAGNYTLNFNQLVNVDAIVQLEDLKTGVTQPIQQGDLYSFVTQDGDLQERFILHFSYQNISGTKEPVEISSGVMPNPAYDFIVLKGDISSGASWTIGDLSGRIIRTGNYPAAGAGQKIDIRDLEAGAYYLYINGKPDSGNLFIKHNAP